MTKKQLFYVWLALLSCILPGCYGDTWHIDAWPGFQLESISFDRTSVELKQGDTCVLKVAFFPSYAPASELTWLTNDGTVATVDAHGTVVALKPGEASITARTPSGHEAECAVVVRGQVSGEIESSPVGGGNGTGDIEW